MAGGQSLRLLALSSAQSSAADPAGRPLARYLGHSVALSHVLSAAPFPPSLDRSAARSSARLVERALVTSLSFFLFRSFACLLALRTLARSLAGSAPCALARVRTCVLAAPVRAIVRSCSVVRPLVRFACSVARSVGHSPLRLGRTVFTRTTFRGMSSERNSGREPRQATFLMG